MEKKKSIFKRWWFWLIVILVIGAVATAGSGDDDSDEPKKVAENQQEKKSEEKKEENKIFKVGDTIQLGDHKLTVTKVDKSNGDEFEQPKSGHEFIIVHVRIENGGKDNVDYNPFDFQLKNSQGNIVDPGFITVDSDTALEAGELAPGGKVEGTVSFEAPKGDKGLELIFTPSFWSDKKITIKLN